jgi:hypothetical protein
MNPPRKIQFDLLANARDSLRQSIDLIAWKDGPTDHARLKHAIISAAHSIELLLKERLRQVHPAFVWEKVDEYPKLDKRTVTVDTAISRLRTIAAVDISKDDERNLKSLRMTRNAIEHYEWTTTEKEAKILVGNALSFALTFAAENLGTNLEGDFKRDDTWRELLRELSEFTHVHGQRIAARHRREGSFTIYCDECEVESVPSGGGSCELCGHWQVDDDSWDDEPETP